MRAFYVLIELYVWNEFFPILDLDWKKKQLEAMEWNPTPFPVKF